MENLPGEKREGLPEISNKKEIIPSRVQEEIEKLIPYAGTIELAEEQKKFLFAPVKEEDIEIRADGLVYLPWMEYVSRLRDAFGISWAIIPYGMPKLQGNHMFWPFYLIIQGKLAGFAIGEQEYFPNSARMSYSDASEGAKSNALMRLCKGIGISLELWKPSFVREWKAKYAEEYTDQGKKLWRKKVNRKVIEQEPEQNMEQQFKESAIKCAEYHDRLIQIKNKFELENYWKKHYREMEKELMPEHIKILTDLKDALKEKLNERPRS